MQQREKYESNPKRGSQFANPYFERLKGDVNDNEKLLWCMQQAMPPLYTSHDFTFVDTLFLTIQNCQIFCNESGNLLKVYTTYMSPPWPPDSAESFHPPPAGFIPPPPAPRLWGIMSYLLSSYPFRQLMRMLHILGVKPQHFQLMCPIEISKGRNVWKIKWAAVIVSLHQNSPSIPHFHISPVLKANFFTSSKRFLVELWWQCILAKSSIFYVPENWIQVFLWAALKCNWKQVNGVSCSVPWINSAHFPAESDRVAHKRQPILPARPQFAFCNVLSQQGSHLMALKCSE